MPSVISAATIVVLAYLFVMAAVLATQLLSGAINTRGLLYGRRDSGALYFSPERVQLLAVTVWTALTYVGDAAQRHALPDIPSATLAVLGGSHAIYLGGKAVARFLPAGADERTRPS